MEEEFSIKVYLNDIKFLLFEKIIILIAIINCHNNLVTFNLVSLYIFIKLSITL